MTSLGRETPPALASPLPYRWLATGEEGLCEMLRVINEARVSVLLETYIFASDSVGCQFLETLVAARKRGVRVKVLLDAVGSLTLPSRFWTPLLEVGGEFRWFNSFNISEQYGLRNHRKLLVVDDAIAIIGGFNIAQVYQGDGVHYGWRDLGLSLSGDPVAALRESFEQLFAKAGNRPLPFSRLRKNPDTRLSGDDWTLLFSGPGWGHKTVRQSLERDLSKAFSVDIISAYFLPTWRLRRALAQVAKRGGAVRLILAGVSDVKLSQWAGRALYRKLLRAGVRIYEYQPQVLHSKLFLIDAIAYVGSANLDARSLKVNYELLLRLDSPATAREGRTLFEAHLPYCKEVTEPEWQASRRLWSRLLERIAYFFLARIDPALTRQRWRQRADTTFDRL